MIPEDPLAAFAAQRRTFAARGEKGVGISAWLDRLPQIVTESGGRWSLTLEPAFSRLSYNYVVPAVRDDGTPAVLKLSFPQDREFRTEVEALRLFGGRGAVRLLEWDLELGAMLLERCEPGTPLIAVEDDDVATSAAAGVLRRMWRPAPTERTFPLISDWATGLDRLRRRFGGETGPMPAALVEGAEALFEALIPSQAEPVLLHGDFHHENVLAARREPWMAIDPKGVVGEPAYDAATLLREPPWLIETPRPGPKIERRLYQLSEELGLDRERLRGWALAQSVLAAYWGLEDSGRVWGEALAFAEILAGIKT